MGTVLPSIMMSEGTGIGKDVPPPPEILEVTRVEEGP